MRAQWRERATLALSCREGLFHKEGGASLVSARVRRGDGAALPIERPAAGNGSPGAIGGRPLRYNILPTIFTRHRFGSLLALSRARSRPPGGPAPIFIRPCKTCCSLRARSVSVPHSRCAISSTKRKARPRWACRLAFIPMPSFPSVTRWGSSGRYGAARWPVSFTRIVGGRPGMAAEYSVDLQSPLRDADLERDDFSSNHHPALTFV